MLIDDVLITDTRGLERVEQNSASRIEQFHLEGGTKYNKFLKKWDFQYEQKTP